MPPPPRPLPRSLKPVPARVHETHHEETISGISVATPSTPATLPRPMHRQATWVRPRAPLPPQRVHSRRQMDDHLRQACCERWGQILPRLGQHSNLAIAFAKSERPDDFLSLSLRKFTPSTLQTYFRHIGTFLDYLGTLGGDLESMTLAKLVGFLFSCSAGQREDRMANICGPRPMLKALSWLQRHAQIPALAPIIQNPLVLAFHASEGPVDRREAIPIPLAVIASWERCVCHDSAPRPSPLPGRAALGGTRQPPLWRPAEDPGDTPLPHILRPTRTMLGDQDHPTGTTFRGLDGQGHLYVGGTLASRPRPEPGQDSAGVRLRTLPGLRPAFIQPQQRAGLPNLQRPTRLQPGSGGAQVGGANPLGAFTMPDGERGEQPDPPQPQGHGALRRPSTAPAGR